MRAASAVVLAAVVVVWVLGFSAVGHRQQGLHTAGSEVEPLIVSSQRIESLLSGADASAANSFLAGGVEPANQRARYEQDFRQALDEFAGAARAGGTSAKAQAAIRTIAEAAPVYAGLVEQARANNRQGFPVGAGYLRRATGLLHGQILPAAETLHEEALVRLNAGYRAASGSSATIGALAAGVVLLVALAGAQVFLRRRTNRVLNVGLVAATALSAALLAWLLVAFGSEGRQVAQARERAGELNVLSQARVTAFRAKSDESFALIARGNGSVQYRDFDAAVADLGSAASRKGLLAEATRRAGLAGERAALAGAAQAFQTYLAVHDRIHTLDTSGGSSQAIAAALATGSGSSNEAFDRFDNALTAAVSLTQNEFDGHIGGARHRLAGLAIGTTLGFVLATVLVLFGIQLRLREYR